MLFVGRPKIRMLVVNVFAVSEQAKMRRRGLSMTCWHSFLPLDLSMAKSIALRVDPSGPFWFRKSIYWLIRETRYCHAWPGLVNYGPAGEKSTWRLICQKSSHECPIKLVYFSVLKVEAYDLSPSNIQDEIGKNIFNHNSWELQKLVNLFTVFWREGMALSTFDP